MIPVSVFELNIAPTVSWITSDRSIFAEPSNETPWIVLAVSNAVAVAAFPVVSWLSVPTVKSKVPSESSYATVIPLSVLDVTIAPTISSTDSVRSVIVDAVVLTAKSIVPSPSWYVALTPVSVLPENIAPTMSCTLSAFIVTSPDDTVKSVPSNVAIPLFVSVASSTDIVAVEPSPCVWDTSIPSPADISNR